MKRQLIVGGLLFGMSAWAIVCIKRPVGVNHVKNLCNVRSVDDIVALFPKSTPEIESRMAEYKKEAKEAVNLIIAISDDQRTFQNTARALDIVGSYSDLHIGGAAIEVLQYVCPDKEIREAAQKALIDAEAFAVDHISNNVELYQAFKAYVEGNAKNENLTAEQQYFLKETMDGFKRAGLELPKEKREEVKRIKKKLTELGMQFETNIAKDATKIIVKKEELAGLKDDVVAGFEQDDAGNYVLGLDYPTYFGVMENCTIEKTRKAMSQAFSNRAYPQNEVVLKKIIAKRDELAHVLGYKSYAHLSLSYQMVGTPERAHDFVQDLVKKSAAKAQQEFEMITAELPDSVTLVDGKLKPWDGALISTYYKKKHFSIDEEKIAEYFPMQKTVDELLDVYRQFFSIDFKQRPISGLWHDEVKMVEVLRDGKTLGYLLLDLHPRPNKYTHAAHVTIVRAVHGENGHTPPGVSLVMANFPKPTKNKPALLKRKDVKTFFHEFGHALHALLGRTQCASCAGTSVKTDFVEMPSQMLEDWLFDKEILNKVSNHYQTGESLPDEIIDSILRLKQFGRGSFVQSQAVYAMMSLIYFLEGAEKDPYAIMKNLYASIKKNSLFDEDNHSYASFGHLNGYGPKYYGYLWASVFAKDLFAEIKKHGLLNPEIGKRYIDTVIGKGGSQHPDELLKNFLGREPNQEAFLRDMGLMQI